MNECVSMPGLLRVGLGDVMPAANEYLLSQVQFSTDPHQPSAPERWPVGLERLHGPTSESWFVDSPVQTHHHDGFVIQNSSKWAWLGCEITCSDRTDFSTLADDIFTRLHQACKTLGKTHIARIWTVIPDIHRGSGDKERYKQFCLGRHHAYQALGLSSSHYPAATVIGGHTNILRFHVLASSMPVEPIENPRQTSAYEYPREYGPRSPSFSRAMKLPSGDTLVSGTAAIRGAESCHPEDTTAQIQEIAENLNSLGRAAQTSPSAPLKYARLYLRNPQDFEALQASSKAAWPQSTEWPILTADICRENLRCEIETVFPA